MAGYKLLIVDDEAPVRKALRRTLQYEGYEILDSEDPIQALEILKNEDVDLVISDHTMPGMLGIDFLRKVRLLKADTIRIILTGNADLDMALKAINEGEIFRFLTKPWDNNELLVTIRMGIREIDLKREIKTLRAIVNRQQTVLDKLEKKHPGITDVQRTPDGKVVISDADLADLESEFTDVTKD